jgi:hypothetical protein
MSAFAELASAHAIYTGSNHTRLELEARILARQSPAEISGRLSVSPGCVEAYCATFFDVRDRLNAGSYIRQQVLKPARAPAPSGNLLMSIAYYGGPVLLDAVLHCSVREVSESGRSANLAAERLSILIQAQELPMDDNTAQDLVRHVRELIDAFPRFSTDVNLIGVFSQIASPFDGVLDATESSPVGSSTRAA